MKLLFFLCIFEVNLTLENKPFSDGRVTYKLESVVELEALRGKFISVLIEESTIKISLFLSTSTGDLLKYGEVFVPINTDKNYIRKKRLIMNQILQPQTNNNHLFFIPSTHSSSLIFRLYTNSKHFYSHIYLQGFRKGTFEEHIQEPKMLDYKILSMTNYFSRGDIENMIKYIGRGSEKNVSRIYISSKHPDHSDLFCTLLENFFRNCLYKTENQENTVSRVDYELIKPLYEPLNFFKTDLHRVYLTYFANNNTRVQILKLSCNLSELRNIQPFIRKITINETVAGFKISKKLTSFIHMFLVEDGIYVKNHNFFIFYMKAPIHISFLPCQEVLGTLETGKVKSYIETLKFRRSTIKEKYVLGFHRLEEKELKILTYIYTMVLNTENHLNYLRDCLFGPYNSVTERLFKALNSIGYDIHKDAQYQLLKKRLNTVSSPFFYDELKTLDASINDYIKSVNDRMITFYSDIFLDATFIHVAEDMMRCYLVHEHFFNEFGLNMVEFMFVLQEVLQDFCCIINFLRLKLIYIEKYLWGLRTSLFSN